ncbi:MAG: heparinase II/III family protein [Clostridia bacterium]|nr:heparinase II/III family protein [Clostridia bacterium]
MKHFDIKHSSIKKFMALSLSFSLLSGFSFVKADAAAILNSYNFSTDTAGTTPSYVTGNAVVSSKALDATGGRKASFSAPAAAVNSSVTARVKGSEAFTLRIYDEADYESFRIIFETANEWEKLAVVLKNGCISVVCGDRQIAERKTVSLEKITEVEFKNVLIDDVAIGDQSIAPRIVNPHIYIDGDALKLGYIFFAPDGEKESGYTVDTTWFYKETENGNVRQYGTGMTTEKPTDDIYLWCEAEMGSSTAATIPVKASELDVLVFDFTVSAGYNSAQGKQTGITFKNKSGSTWTAAPRINDWSQYNEIVLRSSSRTATNRVYQLQLNSNAVSGGNNYFYTYFKADWQGNKKDIVLPIGQQGTLAKGGSPGWSKITGASIGTSLTTEQQESGSLTQDEKNTYIEISQVFLRKNTKTKVSGESEFIPDADRKSTDGINYTENILKENHPRILLTDEKLTSLKKDIVSDAYLKKTFEVLKANVKSYMAAGAMTAVSSSNASQLTVAALIYNLEPDASIKEWIWNSLNNTSLIENASWDPQSESFLAVGDTLRAVAMTYDWMYNHWTKTEQTLVRNAIMRCGMMPVLPYIRTGIRWAGAGFGNWNQALLSGIGMGALAICDEEQYADLCNEILDRVNKSLIYGMRDIDENGAHDEGVAYWHYAMSTFLPYEAALSSICKTNCGLLDGEKMALTGYFPVVMTGPQGIFSFADAFYPSNVRTGAFYRLSEYFDNPAFGAYQYDKSKSIGGDYLSLLLYDTDGYENYQQHMPSYKYYPGSTESFVMRKNWGVEDSYLAFKGGQNGISHSQLDIGTFVYDIQNVRWICDLGRDSYMDYDNKTKYYRNRAEGNNCLVINPDENVDQVKNAYSRVIEYNVGKNAGYGIIDMTSAYDETTSTKRGFAMLDNFETLVIQDEIKAEEVLSEIYSFMHTEQIITLSDDKKSAVMTPADGRKSKVYVTLLSDCGAELSVMDAQLMKLTPYEEQVSNSRYKKLAVKAEGVKDAAFAVVISSQETSSYSSIVNLDNWSVRIAVGESLSIECSEETVEILPDKESLYTLSAATLDGTALTEGISYSLAKSYEGVSLSGNELKITPEAKVETISVHAQAGGKTASLSIPVVKNYILVNGQPYTEGTELLTAGSNTVSAAYADSRLTGDARLYIAHYSGGKLEKLITNDVTSTSVLDLFQSLDISFKENDYIKIFVWSGSLVPVANERIVK